MLTVGVDTYVSVEEADDYISKNYLDSDSLYELWFDLDEEQKEVYLRKSIREIDALAFAGRKCTPEQTLAFPRYFLPSRPMRLIAKIPDDIKYAQIENALVMSDPNKVSDNEFYQRMRTFGVASYSIGHMAETLVQWNGGANSSSDKIRTGSLSSIIASYLVQPYLVNGVSIR